MASTSHNPIPRPAIPALHPVLITVGLLALLFLALPWSLEHKAHMVLHGLCAQRPSHTYYLGDQPLPFDARMTGIYLGYLVTTIALFATGAHRWCAQPSRGRLILLLLCGGVMVADGFNSLLKDLQLPYPYEPHNWLRVATGMSAGLVLATGLCFLIASSLWRQVDTRRQTWESFRSLPVVVVALVGLGLLVGSGLSWLYAPMSLLLIASALAAVTSLVLVVIVLITRRDFSYRSSADLGRVGPVAIALAIAVMLALSLGRTLLEAVAGPTTLT